jgi:peptide deformylase
MPARIAASGYAGTIGASGTGAATAGPGGASAAGRASAAPPSNAPPSAATATPAGIDATAIEITVDHDRARTERELNPRRRAIASPPFVPAAEPTFTDARYVYARRMRLEIVQAGEPVLRQLGRPLTPAEIAGPEIQRLIEMMRETMRHAPGVGLAAPQIGLPLALVVIEDVGESAALDRNPVPFHVVANPRLSLGDERVDHFEGCLSVEGFQAVVPRARTVHVDALDHRGEPVAIDAHGWYARILQHEIDHLNGTLYIDRMRSRTLSTARNMHRHWVDVPMAEVLSRVGA